MVLYMEQPTKVREGIKDNKLMMNLVQFIKMFMNKLKQYQKTVTFLDMYKERDYDLYIHNQQKQPILILSSSLCHILS